MKKGIYHWKLSLETRGRMSVAQKGNKHWLGKKHSVESIEKMRRVQNGHLGTNTGRKFSLETRAKMSAAQKGRVFSEDHLGKIRTARIGKKHSIETRRKMSEARRGENHPMFGKHHSPEARRKISEWNVANPNTKFKDTKIELKVEKELFEQGISYLKQYPLQKVTVADFYLPELNAAVQCDGCYWHNCPTHNPKDHIEVGERDSRQDFELKSLGIEVYRFWEHEINENVSDCIKKIKKIT